MRRSVRVLVALSVATAAGATALVVLPAAPREPRPDRDPAVDELASLTTGTVDVRRDPVTGAAGFVGTDPGQPLDLGSGGAGRTGLAFTDRFGDLLGAGDTDLVDIGHTPSLTGGVAVRLQQEVDGVPVFGGQATVQVDRDGDVLSSLADLSPRAGEAPSRATVPAVTARITAIEAVARDTGASAGALEAGPPEAQVYDPLVVGADDSFGVRLTWLVEVTASTPPVRHLVLVDATTGAVALSFSQLAHAVNRKVCDFANAANPSPTCTSPVRVEAGPPTGVADVNQAYDFSGAAYAYYAGHFGRDGIDDAGSPIVSSVRYCETAGACPYANAFWNGTQLTFGSGYATDDVVAHELTHGVTEHTANLFFWYQSGAINESMSDVFGELIDLATGSEDTPANRWVIGENLPTGHLRDMADPPAGNGAGSSPDPDSTAHAAYAPGPSDAGGVHTNSGVGNKAAFLMTDGGTFGGHQVTGLGPDKVAAVYYEALTTLLTSASDYQDLHAALPQACANLVSGGLAGLTAGDCLEVRDAVDAVGMNAPPVNAPAVDVTPCPDGQVPDELFYDDLEAQDSGNWGTQTKNLGPSGFFSWAYEPVPLIDYATSGDQSFWGPDVGGTSDRRIQMQAALELPAGVTHYLHFRHAFGFDSEGPGLHRDGGVVEYSADGGPWTDLGHLFQAGANGYNGTLSAGGTNPLEGRPAFVDESKGYLSSRADLTSLAGQAVRFRFRIGENATGADFGWFVDDIGVYLCPEPAVEFTQTTDGPSVTVGDDIPLHLTVTNTGNVTLTGVTVADDDAPACAGPVPDIPVGESETVDCMYTTVDPDDIGTWTSAPAVTVDQLPGTTLADPLSVEVLEPGTPALTIVLSADQDAVDLGQAVDLHLTVQNTGNVELHGTAIDAPEAPGCEVEGIVDPLPIGAEGTVDCNHTPTALGPWTGTASVTATELPTPIVAEPVTVEVVDGQDPEATITSPADDAVFNQGQLVLADYACDDDQDPVPACVGPVTDGAAIDTTIPGEHTFTVTATDQALNEAEVSHAYTVALRRPDGRIRLGATGATVGDDLYNSTGVGQTRTTRANRGTVVTLYVTVENDGTHPEAFRVRGQASTANYQVRYLTGGVDVSVKARTGTYLTPELDPGETRTIKVLVTVGAQAPVGSQVSRLVTTTSTSDPLQVDVVRFVVQRR